MAVPDIIPPCLAVFKSATSVHEEPSQVSVIPVTGLGLTPPDPITQVGLAIPLLLLYELSIFTVRFTERKKESIYENQLR